MKHIYLFLLSFTVLQSNAQCFWAKSIGGPNDESASAIVLDNAKNVYTTGHYRSTVDFDPGPGVSNLTSGWYASYINKLDSMGNFIWAKAIGTSVGAGGWSDASYITNDAAANLYVCGHFQDTCDFDPGPGVTYFVAGTAPMVYSAYVCKYDSAGNLIWAQAFGGANGCAVPMMMRVDAAGNIYVTGSFRGTVDFDPGPGVQTATTTSIGTDDDVFISKLDALGNLLWVATMGSTGVDNGLAIQTDSRGNVYTVGRFENTVDFDPGASTANLTSAGGKDIFICKLDSGGNYKWAKSMGNATHDEMASAIRVGNDNQIFVGGVYGGTVDFDPGAGVHNLTSTSLNNSFVAQYDSSGNYRWAKALNGSSDVDVSSLALDSQKNLYITGEYFATADFDPGSSTYNLTSTGNSDVFVSKLDSSGNFVFAKSVGGPQSDGVTSIAINYNRDMFITGTFIDSADFDPSSGSYVLMGNGSSDIFISKINSPLLANISSFTSPTCYGASNGSATVTPSGGSQPYSYVWSTTPTQTAQVATGLHGGPVSVTVTESYGCISTASVNIPQPALDSSKICMVTVDSASEYNIIMWDKTSFTDVDSFIVYREIATNNYQPIGVVAFDSLSQFVDTVRTKYAPNTGNPNSGTYRYKMKTKNACGVSSPYSPYHNTIYFLHSGATFFWTQLYTIENSPNPVTSYDLMRDDFSTGNWQIVTSVAGTQQTVNDPLYTIYQNTASWRVQTNWNISCTPTLRMSSNTASTSNTSISNVVTNIAVGIKNTSINQAKVYPTENNGIFTVEMPANNSKIEIYSAIGELVHSSKVQNEKTTVDVQHLAKGAYMVRLINEKGSSIKKIVIE